MELLGKYWAVLLQGGVNTLVLFVITCLTGLFFGVLLGHLQYFSKRGLRKTFSVVGLIIVSCPIIVLLHWAYFPLQIDWSTKFSPFWTSAAVLSVLNAVLIMDVVYRGIESMPKTYLPMKKMYDISWLKFIRKIWMPTLFVTTLHSLLLTQLNMLHATLFAALIGVEELFRSALRINSVEINGTTVFSVMALAFIIVSLPIHLLAGRARKVADKILGR